MRLEVITALPAWPTGIDSQETLSAGSVVTAWRIVRGGPDAAEPYRVFFECGGREYSCALYRFLPRTRSVRPAAEIAALESAVEVLESA